MDGPLKFTVPGVPVSKGRARYRCVNGVPMPYTPKETREYEQQVKGKALVAMQGRAAQLKGPLSIRGMANIPILQSWSKKKRSRVCFGEVLPTDRPDLDNYTKAAFDVLNGVVFKDDSQITDVIVTKRYKAEAALVITVAPIEPAGPGT